MSAKQAALQIDTPREPMFQVTFDPFIVVYLTREPHYPLNEIASFDITRQSFGNRVVLGMGMELRVCCAKNL